MTLQEEAAKCIDWNITHIPARPAGIGIMQILQASKVARDEVVSEKANSQRLQRELNMQRDACNLLEGELAAVKSRLAAVKKEVTQLRSAFVLHI